MTNRPSVGPADRKRQKKGEPALTERFCGFDSRLLLGPVHTKDVKSGSGSWLHGTHNEEGTTKHNWLACVSIM